MTYFFLKKSDINKDLQIFFLYIHRSLEERKERSKKGKKVKKVKREKGEK